MERMIKTNFPNKVIIGVKHKPNSSWKFYAPDYPNGYMNKIINFDKKECKNFGMSDSKGYIKI